MPLSAVLLAVEPVPAHHAHMVALGDVPTWLAVIGAAITAWVALRQFARQTRVLERQQADQVDVRPLSVAISPPGTPPPGPGESGDDYHVAVVYNGSRRPIHDVVCRIEPTPGGPGTAATRVGEWIEFDEPMRGRQQRFQDSHEVPAIELIRVSTSYAFAFPFRADDYPTHGQQHDSPTTTGCIGRSTTTCTCASSAAPNGDQLTAGSRFLLATAGGR